MPDQSHRQHGGTGATGATGTQECFTPGTLVATSRGERRVETLRVGDRVLTAGVRGTSWFAA